MNRLNNAQLCPLPHLLAVCRTPNGKRQARASGICGALSLSALTLLVVSHAEAVSVTWDGSGGSNANWTVKQNWDGPGNKTVPVAGDDISFSSNNRLTNNNDTTAATSYNSITFNVDAGAFILDGNSVTLGAGISGSSITNNSSSLQTINLALILSGDRTITTTSGNITIGGAISSSGFGIAKQGSNTLTLSNTSNSYSGLTSVSAGTLAYGASNVISTGAVTVSATGILNLGANQSDTVGIVTLQGNGQINGSGTSALTSTGTFEMQSGSVGAILAGSDIVLNKTTSGTVTLSGANTYSGQTNVNGGKLTVSSTGTINGTSGVTISGGELNYNSGTALTKNITFSGTGGKLSGSGTLTPAVTLTSGNTYSAGVVGDPGTQTLSGGLILEAGSIFSWDLDATNLADPGVVANAGSYDKVTGNGSGSGIFRIVLGSNAFTDAFWDTNKTWTDIFSGSDPVFSLFDGVGVASNGVVTGEGQFSYSGNTLTWAAVPEPTSALAGLLLAGGLLRRRRQ